MRLLRRLARSGFVRDSASVVLANAVSLLVSLVSTLVIPKVLGVEGFGYWQAYLLYSSFAGLMHLGWNDGILLRYAGATQESIDSSSLRKQFFMLICFEFLLGTCLVLLVIALGSGGSLQDVLVAVVIAGGMSCLRFMLMYVLLAVKRVGEYAAIVVAERVLFLCLALGFLFINASFWSVVGADILAKVGALIFAAITCRRIVFARGGLLPLPWREVWENISSGSKLLLSSLILMLILGVGRIGVERQWGIPAFSLASLALSLVNVMLGVLSAVSGVVFAHMASHSTPHRDRYFFQGDNLVTALLFGGLLGFELLRTVVLLWLPEYTDSIPYLLLLLPMVFFQGRAGLLLEPLLKAGRRENAVLLANFVGLIACLLVAGLGVFAFQSVFVTISSMTAGSAVRSIVAEFMVRSASQEPRWLDYGGQILGIIVFYVVSTHLPGLLGSVVWLLVVSFVFTRAWRRVSKSLMVSAEVTIASEE